MLRSHPVSNAPWRRASCSPAAAFASVAIVLAGSACIDRSQNPDGRLPSVEPLNQGSGAPGTADRAPTQQAEQRPIAIVEQEPPTPPERMPSVAFLQPKNGQSIPADKVDVTEVKLDVRDWPIAAGSSHVHLVLDNEPYKAVYDVNERLRVGDIVPNRPLEPGQHVMVAFPSDASHTAVRPDKAKVPHAIIAFSVDAPQGAKKGDAAAARGAQAATDAKPPPPRAKWKAGEPMLVSSRPKGTYNGADADRVLLDFYLVNVGLGPERHRVQATVMPPNGEPVGITITKWAPYAIMNLPSGDTTVRLELLDKDGRPAQGAWNRVDRVITVNREASLSQPRE